MPKKSRRQSAAREERKRWVAIAGIALFLALDIFLVVLALQSTSPRNNGSASAEPSVGGESTAPASPSASPTPPTSGSTAVTAVAPTRILAALDATVAWRATTGACPEATATPELTVDGGVTWASADLTAATGVMALQRIFVSGSDTATFLGSGADCVPEVVRTFVGGADFADYPDQLDRSWYLAPVGSATVHAPGGDVAAPCPSAVTVAPLDASRAAVLCADSGIHLTADAGATWTTLAATPGAVALTEMTDGFLVASAGAVGCAGVQLIAVAVDDSRTALDCVESSEPASDLAGSIAVDWTAEGIWLWVGERLLISTDEGATWS
jgi:hypothetical protein